MPKVVKLIFPYPKWPLMRQTPNFSGQWGDYQFVLNDAVEECDYLVAFEDLLEEIETATCPPENTLFITAEYSVRKYDRLFLRQFQHVMTCQTHIVHPHIFHSMVGHPWFVGKSYDELKQTNEVAKSKKISIISSNKKFIPGHHKRLAFVTALKDYFGDSVDFFGRGIRGFEDKWDVLAPYQYSIAIENDVAQDWMTEKLFDCFLAHTVPLYFGAPNAERYFPKESMFKIDINDVEGSKKIIRQLLDSDDDYHQRLEAILQAKQIYLERYHLFPLVVDFIESNKSSAVSQKTKQTFKKNLRPDLRKTVETFPQKVYFKLKQIQGSLANHLGPKTPDNSQTQWIRDNGDETHKVAYELDNQSVVFDLGAGQGDWASDIAMRYASKLHVFEANPDYAAKMRMRFGNNQQVSVHNFELAHTSQLLLGDVQPQQNTTSLVNPNEVKPQTKFVQVVDFFREYPIHTIDLMNVDIAGREYDLLEHLLEENLITKFNNIQVRFYDAVPNAKSRMEKIQQQLSKTHELTYQYVLVWENWRLKKTEK